MEELILTLNELNKSKMEIDEKIKTIKLDLEENYLNEEGYKTDDITISYTKPSETKTIDLGKLAKEEPKLYEELLEDYPKVTTRKGSYRYSFK